MNGPDNTAQHLPQVLAMNHHIYSEIVDLEQAYMSI